MNYYEQIKTELINNEVYKKIKDYSKNKSDLNTYYNVGKLIVEAQGGEARSKYGNGLIKEYSEKLMEEINKKYNYKTLLKIRNFYIKFKNVATLSRILSFSHYVEMLSLTNMDEINYYISISEKNNLGIRELRKRIKSKEYERLDEDTKIKLIHQDKIEIKDMIKNPIIIKNKYDTTKISEKMLSYLILEDISSFLSELGDGFCFIKNEYKIKLGNTYNYIDILLYNIIYNCYIVVELKVTELRKEHIGQISIYMNYIDENIKNINQNKTIGIIICKENNEFIIKYSSDKRILSKEFVLN